MRTAAYVYTGWHAIAERDVSFHPGFTEWELVRACQPRFQGHAQPKVPLLGEYDDRDPEAQALIKDGQLMISEGTISVQSESHPTQFRRIELKKLQPKS